MFPGAGTALNVLTVLAGSGIGLLLRQRFPSRTRDVVTDALGLVTLLVAALSAADVLSPDLSAAVGTSAPVLIVLGSLLLGGIVGSLLRLEYRLESLGRVIQRHTARVSSSSRPRGADGAGGAGTTPGREGDEHRFVQAFLTASLVFCVGPLTVLGALSDGLGRGIDMLSLKSVLDGFAAIAFAASLGAGVVASVLTIIVVQGGFTLAGVLLGDVLPDAHISALTATGGLLLVGVALRLLQIKQVPVADLLPALLAAPLIVELVVLVR